MQVFCYSTPFCGEPLLQWERSAFEQNLQPWKIGIELLLVRVASWGPSWKLKKLNFSVLCYSFYRCTSIQFDWETVAQPFTFWILTRFFCVVVIFGVQRKLWFVPWRILHVAANTVFSVPIYIMMWSRRIVFECLLLLTLCATRTTCIWICSTLTNSLGFKHKTKTRWQRPLSKCDNDRRDELAVQLISFLPNIIKQVTSTSLIAPTRQWQLHATNIAKN